MKLIVPSRINSPRGADAAALLVAEGAAQAGALLPASSNEDWTPGTNQAASSTVEANHTVVANQ
jgi:hypothetical protein